MSDTTTQSDAKTPGDSTDAEGSRSSVHLSDLAERVFHRLPVGIVVFDDQFRVLSQNAAAAFLARPDEPVTEWLQQATIEGQYQDWSEELRGVLATGTDARFENVACEGPDGQARLVNISCTPLPEEDDHRILGGVLVLEDITLQASMEQRLAVSERLAAVGKLAARVAHELNNPLDGILRYINLAMRVGAADRDDRIERYLSEAKKGMMRMAQIVRELLQFSRTSHSDYSQTSVNELVEDAVKALAKEANAAGVTVILSLESELPPLHAGSLFQVFCNLIKNAIDAMPNGGTLTVTTKKVEQHMVVRFDDTGVGLPKEIDRIFEPFFTTKEQGKGTGLGLAVSRDIVERHNGQMTAENREGGGARFEIRVPLSSCVGVEAASESSAHPKG